MEYTELPNDEDISNETIVDDDDRFALDIDQPKRNHGYLRSGQWKWRNVNWMCVQWKWRSGLRKWGSGKWIPNSKTKSISPTKSSHHQI